MAIEICLEDGQDTDKTGTGKSERASQVENKQHKQRLRDEKTDLGNRK